MPVKGGNVAANTNLAEQVRARRASLALVQEELAELSGTSVRFIRSLEQGKATVRLDKVQAVLEVLGLELTARLRVSAVSARRNPRSYLHELTSVREAHVFKGDRLAAVLRRLSGGVEFRYLPEYLTDEGPSVATTLPMSDEPTLTSAGADPPYFADRDFDQLSFGDLLDAAGVIDPVALAGVQDKMSTRVLSFPVQYAGHRYILKLDTTETPHIVANEDYFIRLAAGAHFPVVSASVVHDSTDRPGLLVQRFDRETSPEGGTVSLAVEDGAQVLGIYPADKYAVRAETVVGRLSGLCASRAVALRDLYRQLVFAWLTGNGDVHAKNLSILKSEGEWRVSPAYDLPSTLPYRDTTMALSMLDRRSGFSRRKLLEFGAAIGLPQKTASRVLDEVLIATEPVLDWPASSPYRPDICRDVLRSLRQRRQVVMASAGPA